jgi:hypothetical protein
MRRFTGDAVLSAVWWAGAEGSFSYLSPRGERITAYRNLRPSRTGRSTRPGEWELRVKLREVRRLYAKPSLKSAAEAKAVRSVTANMAFTVKELNDSAYITPSLRPG